MNTLTQFARAIALPVMFAALSSCGRTPLVQTNSSQGGSTSRGCTSNADCTAAEECNPTTGTCVPVPGGCSGDADCASPTPQCRLDTHTCVACLDNTACPSGQVCSDYQCASVCGKGGSCGSGLICCGNLCVDTSSSV